MSFDEAGFQNLITTSGEPHGFYNNRVYNFNAFYGIIGVANPGAVDVTTFNTTDAVADGIFNNKNTGGRGNRNNIFEILMVPGELAAWGIVDVGAYNPVLYYTDNQVRDFLTVNTDRYIIRWKDIYYDVTFVMVVLKNFFDPPVYVHTYPDTFTGVNTAIFDRFLIQDETNYPDILNFIEPGLAAPEKPQVVFDYDSGFPYISIYGRVPPALVLGNTFQGGLETVRGIATAISRDGSTMAFAERSIANDVNSPLNILVYEFDEPTKQWEKKGQTLNTAVVITNGDIFNYSNNFFDLSDDGNTLAIGNYLLDVAGFEEGEVRIYDYNSVTSMWGLRGGITIPGTTGEDDHFGYNVAISGNGNIVMASFNNFTVDGKGVRVYEYNNGIMMWDQRLDNLATNFDPDPLGPHIQDAVGYGLGINFDGSVLAVGNSDPTGTGIGYVYIFNRNGVVYDVNTTPGIAGKLNPPGGRNMTRFGFSLDMSNDPVSPSLVVGAPGTMRNGSTVGAVAVYGDVPVGAELLGDPIMGQPDAQLGFNVSISNDSQRFSASALGGDLTNMNVGYTQVFEYSGSIAAPLPTDLWNYINQRFGLDQTLAQSGFTRMDGIGKRIVVGTPNTPNNNGDVRVFTLDLNISPTVPAQINYTRNVGSTNFIITGAPNFLFVDGGVFPYTPPGTINYISGDIDVTAVPNTNDQFEYVFTPNLAYNAIGAVSETMPIEFIDSQTPFSANGRTFLTVNTTINNPLSINAPALASITRAVDETPNSTGLSGLSFSVTGGSGGLIWGIDAIGTTIKNGSFGTLEITNTATGEYEYTPTAIPNTPGTVQDDFTIIVEDITGDQDTLVFSVNYVVLSVIPPANPPTINRVVDQTPVENDLIGTYNFSGGTAPVSFFIDDGGLNVTSLIGQYGTLNITNVLTGAYQYVPGPPAPLLIPNTPGTYNDTFTIVIDDGSTPQIQTTETLNVVITVTSATPLALDPFINPVIERVVNGTPTPPPPSIFTGTFSASGGVAPYTFDIIGSLSTPPVYTNPGTISGYGTLRIIDPNLGTYQYEPRPITDSLYPNTAGTFIDQFTIKVTDNVAADAVADFSVTYIVSNPPGTSTSYQFLPIQNQGLVITTENSPNITTYNLNGIAAVENGTSELFDMSYIQPDGTKVSGTPTGNPDEIDVTTPNGRFVLNTDNGSYFYDPDFGAIINTTLDIYQDLFEITSVSTNGDNAAIEYSVTYEIRPQFLLGELIPASGQILRNVNNMPGVWQETGTTGFVQPVNGTPPYGYGIGGFFPPTDFTTIAPGLFGSLRLDTTSGEYRYTFTDPVLPPGVYVDQFTFIVGDLAGQLQEQPYIVVITIQNVPLGLLPAFRHSTSREIGQYGYWGWIIHDRYRTPAITPEGLITVPNTELLVVGQTETQSGDPAKNPDNLLRQLLADAAFDRTNPGDVITQVKNNTVSTLDTPETAGIQTTSFKVSNNTGPFVVELSDILSSQHSEFLFNRYRSNVGETVLAIYTDDDINDTAVPPAPAFDKIVNQVRRLITLGTKTVIGVMQVNSLNPKNSADWAKIISLQDTLLLAIFNSLEYETNLGSRRIQSVITQYDPTTDRYLNVSGRLTATRALPNTSLNYVELTGATTVPDPNFPYISSNPDRIAMRNLYGALTQVEIIPEDTTAANELRIVITEVDTVNKIARGEIIYGVIANETSFSSSRFGTNQVIPQKFSVIGESGVLGAPNPVIILEEGSTGQNVSTLKPGDVLFPGTSYSRPRFIRLLTSVVPGYESQPDISGEPIFLQLDDGVRFPNNPVFQGRILSSTPIQQKIDSKTLAIIGGTPSSETMVVHGFDYLLNIELPGPGASIDAQAAAGGIERYIDFPRLGFMTLYFGMNSTNQPLFKPYGRGAVQFISNSVPS